MWMCVFLMAEAWYVTFSQSDRSLLANSGPVSLPGDSGSVWLRSSDRYAVALNFAGPADGSRSISNPIGVVMSSYGVRTAIPAAGGTFRQVK